MYLGGRKKVGGGGEGRKPICALIESLLHRDQQQQRREARGKLKLRGDIFQSRALKKQSVNAREREAS